MEKEETVDPKYQQGFNEGYILTKHLPELSDSLATVKSENPRMEGFRDGRKQLVLEKIKANMPEKKTRDTHKENTQERSKDRDLEPDA